MFQATNPFIPESCRILRHGEPTDKVVLPANVQVQIMNAIEVARLLCERSRLVLVPHGEKGPREKDWHKNPVSLAQYDYAFADSTWPPNVGIILGEQVDFEGDGPEAEADLLELFDGDIPLTPSWQSLRGRHYLFLRDERLLALGIAVIKYKGAEIRLGGAKAAQSLIPPSTTNGFTRTWLVSPTECDPAPIPEAVVQKLLALFAEKKAVVKSEPRPASSAVRPGDAMMVETSWQGILEPHGWKVVNDSDGVTHWCRPGKSDGVSATTGYCSTEDGKDLLFCFSTNGEPFEENHTLLV
jgi:hypothetical protein